MKLSKLAQWAIKQSLGTKRGEMAISLLSGFVGELLDMAAGGKISEALGQADKAVDAVREVIG
jgi:hypothetical protein